MWKYTNTNELYHAGVLGMKWGHRKQSANSISRQEHKQYKKDQLIKDTDKRVKSYGKGMVKTSNRIGMGANVYMGLVGTSVAYNIGKRYIQKMASNPTKPLTPNKLKIASAATLGAMALIGGKTISNISKLHKDNKRVDDYDYRRYLEKKNK